MASFGMTPQPPQGGPPQGMPPGQPPQTASMSEMLGPAAMSPMQAQAEANAGALSQLRQVELGLGQLGSVVQQMATQYPAAAENARAALQGLEQVRQALTGFVVSMVSQMPDTQPPGPSYLGG